MMHVLRHHLVLVLAEHRRRALDARLRLVECPVRLLAEDVAAYVGSLIESLQIPPGNDTLLLAAVLLRRIAGAFEAVIVLAERGMHTEGLSTRRAMLEALFVLGAIHNQPALVETYLKNDDHRRRDIFKRIKKLSPRIRAALAPERTMS